MTHFNTEQWVDFVNEAISTEAEREMKMHLSQGCKACNQTVSLWRKVLDVARAEKAYQPSAEALRIAKTAFVTSILAACRKQACTWAGLVLDTSLQPAVQGARSAGSGTRHMLYRADPYQIDLQIETGPDQRTLVITGQVLDLRQQGLLCGGVFVFISNLRGQLVRATTNDLGEFRNEITDSGELEVVFPGLTEKPVIISVGDPLGRHPAETFRKTGNSRVPRKTRKKT
jgi:hypothetical protein